MRVNCPECNGEGEALYERFVVVGPTGGYYEDYKTQCENCNGSGRIDVDDEDVEDGTVEECEYG